MPSYIIWPLSWQEIEMSHELVKVLIDDDLEEIENPVWHLVDPTNAGGPATLCSGEFFGYGESQVEYELKVVARGGITCGWCMRDLKTLKSIRL